MFKELKCLLRAFDAREISEQELSHKLNEFNVIHEELERRVRRFRY